MASLSALVGLGTEPTIGGKKYRLGPLGRDDWALIEERIKAHRSDPIEVARALAKDQPVEIAREILLAAYSDGKRANLVTAGELDAWTASLQGLMFSFWLMIRKHNPDVDEKRAGDLLEQYGREYTDKLLDHMAEQFPGADRDEILGLALEHEEGTLRHLIQMNMGLPEGNSPSPGTPGTPMPHSPGPDGTPNSGSDMDGPPDKSTE